MTPVLLCISILVVIIGISVTLGVLWQKGIIKIPNYKQTTSTTNVPLISSQPSPQGPSSHQGPSPTISAASSKPSKSSVSWVEGPLGDLRDSPQKMVANCISGGGVFTGGQNEKFPGCGNHFCCKPNVENWLDGKKIGAYGWKGGDDKIDKKDRYDKAARDCTSKGGIYTAGNNSGFKGCGNHSCCLRA